MTRATSTAAEGAETARFMALDPGQFHAALIHKEMDPRISPRIDVYAPLGFDLVEHLGRISAFNTREVEPTRWELEVHARADYLERMVRERPGNTVVIAGRNARKIDYIEAAVAAGLHVLADKPWILRSADLPRLERVLSEAQRTGLVAYDMMTERYEVTNAVQRELVLDQKVFGRVLSGSVDEPAVSMRSVHHILKSVAGSPLRRPLWWFDPAEQGEGLSDVGTHLVDLLFWTLFPGEPVDYRNEVELISARRWPTELSPEQFRRVTGGGGSGGGAPPVQGRAAISCDCNTGLSWSVRGVHVRMDVLWASESSHPDTHDAVYRGERATVAIRQGEAEGWKPEVYVIPAEPSGAPQILEAVRGRVGELAERWTGMVVENRGAELRIVIPERHRLGHERHFGEVTDRFLRYMAAAQELPAWERPNMAAKYYVTTRGTELSHGR